MSCSIGLTPLTAGEALLDVSASSFLDFTGHQFLDSVAPLFERFSLLGRERVQLINADDTGEGATAMGQNFLDHRQRYFQPRHARGHRPPQVVKTPRRNFVALLLASTQPLHDNVDPFLGARVAADR